MSNLVPLVCMAKVGDVKDYKRSDDLKDRSQLPVSFSLRTNISYNPQHFRTSYFHLAT